MNQMAQLPLTKKEFLVIATGSSLMGALGARNHETIQAATVLACSVMQSFSYEEWLALTHKIEAIGDALNF